MSIPFVVIDDSEVNLEGAGWNRQTSVEGVYNASISTLASSRTGTIGNVTFNYPAWSELRIAGRGSSDLSMNYTVGDASRSARFNISDSSVSGKDPGLVWNVTSLTNERLSLRPSVGSFSLDYVAYRPQQDQVQKGDRVLLENTHPYIRYQGPWQQNLTVPGELPFSGQWYVATNNGGSAPSFSTRFRGSSISVYGAYNHAAGDLSMVYALDSEASDTVSYGQGPFGVDASTWTVGLLYQKFGLDPAQDHQFDVYMDNWGGNQIFSLDYLTYEAAEDGQSTVPPPDTVRPPSVPTEAETRRGNMGQRIGVGVAAGVLLLGLIMWRVYVQRKRRLARTNAPRQTGHELHTLPPRSDAVEAPPPPWRPPANPEGEPPPPNFEAIASDPTVTDASGSHRSTQDGETRTGSGTRRSSVDSPPRYQASLRAASPPASPRPQSPPGLVNDGTGGAATGTTAGAAARGGGM